MGDLEAASFTTILKQTLGDESNVNILKSLDEPKTIDTLIRAFGKGVKDNIVSLRNSGLVITILRNNPSSLNEYYKRTVFGGRIAKEID